jgi:hypothetical protein
MLKLIGRMLMVGTFCALLAGAYIAVPFWTAWSIREAIKVNDSAYLQDKIEWVSVRASLKESLRKFAFSPNGVAADPNAKPTLWQRVKSYVGSGAVDQFVDTTVTPTGMSGLLGLRRAYKTTVGAADEVRPPIWVRMQRVWSRVTRAEFKGFDRFEMDMIDKEAPERTINCVLERRGYEWKMTELRVRSTDPAKLAAMGPQLAM